MFTPHRPSTLIPAFIAILTFALSAPGTMYAEDQILADASVLVAVDESSSAGSVDVSRAAVAPLPDSLPAALASGTRPESAHLATIPLPGASVGANSDDRIANALFGDASHGDAPGEASGGVMVPPCSTDDPPSDEPWAAPPERRMPGEPY